MSNVVTLPSRTSTDSPEVSGFSYLAGVGTYFVRGPPSCLAIAGGGWVRFLNCCVSTATRDFPAGTLVARYMPSGPSDDSTVSPASGKNFTIPAVTGLPPTVTLPDTSPAGGSRLPQPANTTNNPPSASPSAAFLVRNDINTLSVERGA